MRKVTWIVPGGDISEAARLRIAVFCDEQGYSKEQELDETDKVSWHVLVQEGGETVATGRIYQIKPQGMALGRIAVKSSLRGTGLGYYTVDQMLKKATALGAKTASLDAQSRAVGFYEKLGFAVCGEEHMDGHVPHKAMEKNLGRGKSNV